MIKKSKWDIVKPNHSCFLEHLRCKGQKSNSLFQSNSLFPTAFLGKDNKWRCPRCGEVAPKEIALMADLCYCYPMPRTANKYYEEEEEKKKNDRTFRKIFRNYIQTYLRI